MNPELLCVQMNDCLMGDGCGAHTEVPDNLPDHVFEHPSAVLGVEEGQELHLVQQLVIWVGVRLVPAVLQTLQHLLGCIHKTNIVTASTVTLESYKNTFSPLTFLVQFQILVIFYFLGDLFFIEAFAGQKLGPVFIPRHVTCGRSATQGIQVPLKWLFVHLGATVDRDV